MKEKTKYSFSGFLAGLINGVFGAGGGMLLVPLFTDFCGMEERKAFASSLCVMLPLSVISLAYIGMQSPIPILDALPICAGGLLGGIIGGKTFQKIPVKVLHFALGIFILWGGVRMVII